MMTVQLLIMACAVQSLESGLAMGMEERDRQLAVQHRLQRRYHQLTLIASQSSSSSSRRTGSRCSTSSTESSGIGDSLSISYPSSDESGEWICWSFLIAAKSYSTTRTSETLTHYSAKAFIVSATLNNVKLVPWPLMGELLHLAQRRGTGRGHSPARPFLAVLNVTVHASVPITV